MTQDEIIEMARQARLMSEYDEASPWVEGHEITEYVTAFAKLVAAKEREACAKLVEGTGDEMSDKNWDSEYEAFAEYAARTIRARGEQ
jgi:hypothetical protein